ncbi:hypothetical protein OH77DRAFT_294274 [Trametes cingulata]|nr:hypothetical protein OH77DRAFT_294274 [Trametes cingulata]
MCALMRRLVLSGAGGNLAQRSHRVPFGMLYRNLLKTLWPLASDYWLHRHLMNTSARRH